MDPSRPASVEPRNIIEPIQRFGVTTMFGSPALLNTVGRYGEQHGIKLPSLRRVIAAGAPMPGQTLARWHAMLPDDGDVFPPYGATESLPVACLPGREIVAKTWAETEKGAGVCVGLPVPDIDVKVIRISDDAIPTFSDDLELEDGEIGEIAVRGPMVTEAYFGDEHNTALSKIRDGNFIWHRMGDVGWRDREGRLWFCGRKSHRVLVDGATMFTVPCEKIFDAHPAVYRSALVGARGLPTLCVELEPGHDRGDWPEIEQQLRHIAHAHPQANRISRFVLHSSFPVDIRHNAKIGREKLAKWVEAKGPS
jgi:acyl-CoA synthetase (AMP-forming)/AMP-acid ligase II